MLLNGIKRNHRVYCITHRVHAREHVLQEPVGTVAGVLTVLVLWSSAPALCVPIGAVAGVLVLWGSAPALCVPVGAVAVVLVQWGSAPALCVPVGTVTAVSAL